MNINIVGVQEKKNNKYLNLLSECGFVSFINVFTRLPAGFNHSCLDHIFINCNENQTNNINSGVILSDITDHCTICVSIPSNAKVDNNDKRYNIIDYNKIVSNLLNEKWNEVYKELSDVNKCYNVFENIIQNAINKSTTTVLMNAKNKRLKDWMTKSLLTSTRHKQSLSMKCKKHPNNIKLNLHYKKFKNNYTKTIRLAKEKFYQTKFKNVNSNAKLTWKLINEIIGSKGISDNEIIKIKLNEHEIHTKNDPITASNTFNNFFTNIAKNITNKSPTLKKYHKIKNISFNEIFSNTIESSDILITLNSLKDDTAAGLDGVTVKILKHIGKYIVDPLAFIYNLSLKQCIFPDKLKIADIKPIFKSGDKTNMNNYRPISMLSNYSKIFEKIIKARLISFLEKNQLLSKNQFGFRPGLSTDNALYKVTQFLYSALDNSKKSLAIFLDIAKAFDTVDHDILLNVLPSFGINKCSLTWFKSYLTNRKQTVKINGINGNMYGIKYGVPQGSVLGPILFILYIN
jgi:hypothetical protein